MAFAKLLSSSGMALAAALLIVPTMAQAQRGPGNGWNRGDPGESAAPQGNASQGNASQGSSGRTWWRGGDNAQRPQRTAPEQSAPMQAAPMPQAMRQEAPRMERRQWNGGEQRSEDRSGWRGRGQVQQAPAWSGNRVERQQAPQQVQQQQVQREWRGRTPQDGGAQANRSWGERNGGERNWGERNRTYSDPGRNRTYQTDRRVSDNRRGDDNRRWNDNSNRRSYDDNRRWDNNRRGYSNDYRRWDNGWRGNNRYDWYAYRSHNRDVFRMGYYRSPYRDWSYRRLGIGFFLDSLFYADSYWIGDPWRYRLPEVYGPYRWVRYYDDVLLVDTYSGEVVDVIYDFFW